MQKELCEICQKEIDFDEGEYETETGFICKTCADQHRRDEENIKRQKAEAARLCD